MVLQYLNLRSLSFVYLQAVELQPISHFGRHSNVQILVQLK